MFSTKVLPYFLEEKYDNVVYHKYVICLLRLPEYKLQR